MWGEIRELLFIKVNDCIYFIWLSFSFQKNLNKAKYSIYRNLPPVFRTQEGSSFEEK